MLLVLLMPVRGGGGSGAARFNFYADSVNGNNANDGTTLAKAKQTLAAVNALLGASSLLGLVPGSVWREQLISAVAINRVAAAPGAGTLPKIDGADVIAPGAFTLSAHPDAAGVTYETTLSYDAASVGHGPSYYTMFENGAWLERRVSVAEVAATPGTFYVVTGTVTSTPRLAYVHPFGNTNPTSDGKTYEYAKRSTVLDVYAYAGVTVQGLHITRGNGAYGPLATGPRSTIRRVLASMGGKHNMVIGSGLTEDCVAFDAEVGREVVEAGIIPYTFYMDNPVGEDWVMTRCLAVLPTGRVNLNASVYSHSSGATVHRNATINAFLSLRAGAVQSLSETQTINDMVSLDNLRAVQMERTSIFRRGLIRGQSGASKIIIPSAGSTPGGTQEISDTAIYVSSAASAAGGGILPDIAGVRTIRNNIIKMDGGGLPIADYYGSPGSIQKYNIIIINHASALFWTQISSDVDCDYNVYIELMGSPPTRFWRNETTATNYFSFATWKSATGKDAHSVVLNATQYADLFLGDLSTGDFRINPACALTFTDGLPLVGNAGVRSYYNWNTRLVAAGQPSKWPTPPVTLAECEAYVGDPAGWDFYP